jgi:hypothetical protein
MSNPISAQLAGNAIADVDPELPPKAPPTAAVPPEPAELDIAPPAPPLASPGSDSVLPHPIVSKSAAA